MPELPHRVRGRLINGHLRVGTVRRLRIGRHGYRPPHLVMVVAITRFVTIPLRDGHALHFSTNNVNRTTIGNRINPGMPVKRLYLP